MQNLLITLLTGLVVGLVFYKLKVPGGMMIGAIVGVSTINILFSAAYMPSIAKVFAQAVAGAFIGCSIGKNEIQNLRKLMKPTLILVGCLLILNLVVGFLIYFTSPLDLPTALFSAVPGGMTDTPIISAEMGADAPKVAAMQFVRLLAGLGIMPYVISKMKDKENVESITTKTKDKKKYTHKGFIITVTVAFVCAYIGKKTGIPAGTMLFALLGSILLGQVYDGVCLPIWAKRCAQVLAGSFIGSSVNMQDIVELKYLIIPIIILFIGYFSASYLIGKLLSKTCNLSLRQGMLAATPAGASDMALIAADVGVDGADVAIIQIGRMMLVITIFPQIIRLICSLILT